MNAPPKDYWVTVKIHNQTKRWPIQAPSEKAAKDQAALALKHLDSKGTVIKAEEKKP